MFATSLRLEVGPLPQNARFALRAIFENRVERTTSDLWNILPRGMFGLFDALIQVLNYMDHFGIVLQNETLCRLSIRLFCNRIWFMSLLCFETLFWNTICICLLTTPLVPYYDFVHRFPGRFWFVRLMTIRPYAVLRFPRLRHRAGFRLELCCDMARDAIRSPMIMIMFGDVRRFETFWCYAVCGASVGVATTFLSVCMILFA